MKSGIIIAMILGLLICLVPLHAKPNPQDDYEEDEGTSGGGDFGCQCTDRTYLNRFENTYHGNCLTPHRDGRFWCYVEKGDESCCQAKTARYKNTHCINFDLCDVENVDADINEERVPGALSTPKKAR